MNIYLLKRKEENTEYDETQGVIVVADTLEEAIQIADARGGDFQREYDRQDLEECCQVGIALEKQQKGILLEDFKEG